MYWTNLSAYSPNAWASPDGSPSYPGSGSPDGQSSSNRFRPDTRSLATRRIRRSCERRSEPGVDYLVTNDRHLLDLNPYEGLRLVSMAEYRQVLVTEGILPTGT
jgi:hypothetical protein